MSRKQEIGICEQCGRSFGYYLVHNGFDDSVYAYCDRCSYTVHLSALLKNPFNITLHIGEKIPEKVEPRLKPCPCGGSFRTSASPRCPHCRTPISPIFAATYIERNAAGTTKGWRWQKNWDDVYSIVIENLVVDEWWSETPAASR